MGAAKWIFGPPYSLHCLRRGTGHSWPPAPQPVCHLGCPTLHRRWKQRHVLEMTAPSQDGQNSTFFTLRFQHIFMSELISAREVFLLNEVVVVPVRFKRSPTPYYPGGMFQKTLTRIIILQGFVHCRSHSEVQGRYLQIATHNALLTPRKLIFLPTLPRL